MRRTSRVGLVVVAAALVAAACGSDNKSSSSGATTTAAPSQTSASSAAASTASTASTGSTAATGGAATQGVTADSITIGLTAGFSGPFAAPIKDYIEGYYVWAAEVNAAGGIHGHQIKIKEYDHGETADGGVAACKAIVADKAVYLPVEAEGAIAHLTAGNCLDEAGVTSMVWQAGDEFVDTWKHTYGALATPITQGRVTAHYIKSRLAPDDKVAMAIGSADIYKTAGDAMKDELVKLGVNVVDTQYVEQDAPSFIPQLQSMKDAGATVVAFSTNHGEATMLKEAETIGFSPKWTGNGYAYDYLPVGNPGVYNGVTATGLSKPTDTPEYAEYLKTSTKYARSQCQSCGQQFLAYGVAKVVGAVLQAAGPDFTLDSLAKGINSITAFDSGVIGPVTWKADKHFGTDELFPLKCCSADNVWQSDGEPSATFSS